LKFSRSFNSSILVWMMEIDFRCFLAWWNNWMGEEKSIQNWNWKLSFILIINGKMIAINQLKYSKT
jgi:hypothetical protein